jgi:hypothetical protein
MPFTSGDRRLEAILAMLQANRYVLLEYGADLAWRLEKLGFWVC